MFKNKSKINLAQKIKTYFKNYWWKLIIIAGVLLVDMLTKFLIVNEVTLIDGVLVIVPTKNFGAGFSMLNGQTWLLIAITFVFLIGIVIFDILFKYKSNLFGVATGLIVSGAIGNLIDRLAFGYVRDFIYLEFIDFPVFNVADIALTFGVILLAVYIVFFLEKSKKKSIVKTENQTKNKFDIHQSDIQIKKDEKTEQQKILIEEQNLQDDFSTNKQTTNNAYDNISNTNKVDIAEKDIENKKNDIDN